MFHLRTISENSWIALELKEINYWASLRKALKWTKIWYKWEKCCKETFFFYKINDPLVELAGRCRKRPENAQSTAND